MEMPQELVDTIQAGYAEAQAHVAEALKAIQGIAIALNVPEAVNRPELAYRQAMSLLEPAMNYWIHKSVSQEMPGLWAGKNQEPEAPEAPEAPVDLMPNDEA
jgi:hypothetical protein